MFLSINLFGSEVEAAKIGGKHLLSLCFSLCFPLVQPAVRCQS